MRRFKVIYDGKVIEHQYAVDSVIEVIKSLIDKFGTEEVLRADHNHRNSEYSQFLVANSLKDFSGRGWTPYRGVYISRDGGHKEKKRGLERIGEELKVSIKVEF